MFLSSLHIHPTLPQHQPCLGGVPTRRRSHPSVGGGEVRGGGRLVDSMSTFILTLDRRQQRTRPNNTNKTDKDRENKPCSWY